MARTDTNTTTHFFREPRALELIRDLLARPRASIWCAGCSSGDEPYSLVITALAANAEVEVLASDVNPTVLRTAERGLYPERHLRHAAAAVRERWFRRVGGSRYQVSDEVRAHVRFALHDLTREEPPGRGFDAVLCRNVMVYFTREQATRAVATMAQALRPGGLLIIGASEWLPAEVRAGSAAAAELQLEELHGVMVYRRGASARTPAPAPDLDPHLDPHLDPPPPSDPPPPAPPAEREASPAGDDLVDHLRRSGDAMLDAGRAADARARYADALGRAPLLPDLHLRLALAWMHDDSPAPGLATATAAAAEALRRCLFLAPDLWPAWLLYAEVLAAEAPAAALGALHRARALLASPSTRAAPAELESFLGDERTARDAVERWLRALGR